MYWATVIVSRGLEHLYLYWAGAGPVLVSEQALHFLCQIKIYETQTSSLCVGCVRVCVYRSVDTTTSTAM